MVKRKEVQGMQEVSMTGNFDEERLICVWNSARLKRKHVTDLAQALSSHGDDKSGYKT